MNENEIPTSVEAAVSAPGKGLDTPTAPVPAGAPSGVLAGMQKTVAAPSNATGGGSTPTDPSAMLAQLEQSLSGNKPVLPPGPLSDQAREIMSSVRNALTQAKTGGAGMQPEQTSDLFAKFMEALTPKPQQPITPTPNATPGAQPAPVTPGLSPLVKMITPSGGGSQLPAYDRNGTTVFLGDDIDLNDTAAVQGRINETNDLIDMMNSAYEED